jgi:hypothetical protein
MWPPLRAMQRGADGCPLAARLLPCRFLYTRCRDIASNSRQDHGPRDRLSGSTLIGVRLVKRIDIADVDRPWIARLGSSARSRRRRRDLPGERYRSPFRYGFISAWG